MHLRKLKKSKKVFLILVFIVIAIIATVFIFRFNFFGKKIVEQEPKKILLLPKYGNKEIVRGDTSKKQVIFTFDGGSGVQSVDKVLGVLKKHKVKGTFFLTGLFVEKNPEVVKKIIDQGGEIFNHTYDHYHLPLLSHEEMVAELDEMNLTLEKFSISSKPYFRAPYGDVDNRVRESAYKAGYESVYWTVDAGDWKESEGETSEQVKEKIISNIAPGTIYLMHLGDNITGKILDEIFSEIKAKGYNIVSLTEGI